MRILGNNSNFLGLRQNACPLVMVLKRLWFRATLEYQRYGKKQEVEEGSLTREVIHDGTFILKTKKKLKELLQQYHHKRFLL